MTLITTEQLRAFAPRSAFAAWAPALDTAAARYAIDTPLRIAHWMGQMGEETGGFTRFDEDLDYSAERLMALWPKRYPTAAAAAPYAMNPRAMGERNYGGRFGNVHPGDGYKYRGRGPMQITFAGNYAAAEKATGRPYLDSPDLLLQPPDGALSAAWFWSDHGCNRDADHDDLIEITRIIEGGDGNDSARAAWVAKAKAIWKA